VKEKKEISQEGGGLRETVKKKNQRGRGPVNLSKFKGGTPPYN